MARRRYRQRNRRGLRMALAYLLFVGGLALLGSFEDILAEYEVRFKPFPPEQQAVIEALLEGEQALKSQDYLQALALLERAAELEKDSPELTDRVRARLYNLKAEAHQQLWHFVEAEQSWRRARTYATGRLREQIDDRIAGLRRVIEQSNTERNERNAYRASPNVGPAATPGGHIAVIYLFVEDAGKGAWGLRQRDIALNAWGGAERWLAEAAAEYGREVRFTRRVFLVDRDPSIKRLRVGGFNSGYQHAEAVAMLATRQLGESSVLDFIERIKQEEDADQAILLIHLDRDARSFASRCMWRCPPEGEYAYILGAARPKNVREIAHVQAHETLHLFGADDLYKIKQAKYYAPRDIMNYRARMLKASRLEPVTAYAVGLIEEKPDAPFEIIVFE